MTDVEKSACPSCGVLGTLKISVGIIANRIGTFSLAGAQMKFTARKRPILTCSSCDIYLIGEFDNDGHASFPPPLKEE